MTSADWQCSIIKVIRLNTSKTRLSLGHDLIEARFIERPNRFLIHCQLYSEHGEGERNNDKYVNSLVVQAHLPDPGRMTELLVPGRRIWLKPSNNPARKTKWTAVLTEVAESGMLVSIDATLPNRLIADALAKESLPELTGWKLKRQEVRLGDSRFDFLLEDDRGRKMALEVKSVTLVKDGIGLFPDAVTARGARHVRELADLCQETGWEAAVLFVGQRKDIERIRPAADIDPVFADTLAIAHQAGVHLMARRCHVTFRSVILDQAVPVEIG